MTITARLSAAAFAAALVFAPASPAGAGPPLEDFGYWQVNYGLSSRPDGTDVRECDYYERITVPAEGPDPDGTYTVGAHVEYYERYEDPDYPAVGVCDLGQFTTTIFYTDRYGEAVAEVADWRAVSVSGVTTDGPIIARFDIVNPCGGCVYRHHMWLNMGPK